jgi:RNA polymerase II subunit A-like phosphatase
LERENTKHLLGQHKLSLIVDLDQTILHATVDPTVGEWLKAKRTSEEGSTTPPPESANFPALDDVAKFQLTDDPMGQGVPHPSSLWYYIKPRYISLGFVEAYANTSPQARTDSVYVKT